VKLFYYKVGIVLVRYIHSLEEGEEGEGGGLDSTFRLKNPLLFSLFGSSCVMGVAESSKLECCCRVVRLCYFGKD